MTNRRLLLACVLAFSISVPAVAGDKSQEKKVVSPALDFTMKNIDGQDVYLGDYQGDVLLVVNVASECGLTPQYKDLEAFYKKYKDQGVKVLAFPANNFGAQEPGTNKEIKQFCKTKFDVTFDLFSKVSVKGDDKCDLYKYLTDTSKNGEFGGEIQWNFQKFLVDRTGRVVARFKPRENP
ncbi:MAG: glutathione peroxidase, partial [Planctomycetes bacterium]|nr:glutathione peroxidase [Planctomycetota bacterium]